MHRYKLWLFEKSSDPRSVILPGYSAAKLLLETNSAQELSQAIEVLLPELPPEKALVSLDCFTLDLRHYFSPQKCACETSGTK